jgi:hypothetical protein
LLKTQHAARRITAAIASRTKTPTARIINVILPLHLNPSCSPRAKAIQLRSRISWRPGFYSLATCKAPPSAGTE